MNISWDGAKARVKNLIDATGVNIYWLKIIESGSDAYGYSDRISWQVSGSAKGIISHFTVVDAVTAGIGHYDDDLDRIYVDPDLDLHNWDQILISGSSVKYLVLPLHIYPVGANGITVSKSALIKKMFPSSGSVNT